jgi:hypothetical protein
MSAAAGRPLFARKGAAAPAGLVPAPGDEAGGAAIGPAPCETLAAAPAASIRADHVRRSADFRAVPADPAGNGGNSPPASEGDSVAPATPPDAEDTMPPAEHEAPQGGGEAAGHAEDRVQDDPITVAATTPGAAAEMWEPPAGAMPRPSRVVIAGAMTRQEDEPAARGGRRFALSSPVGLFAAALGLAGVLTLGWYLLGPGKLASAPSRPTAADAAESDRPPSAPALDLVRNEADGSILIAGQAAPQLDLVVLDDGVPIGTAKADSLGRWLLVVGGPLRGESHHLGVAPLPPQSPAEPPAEPAAEAPAAANPAPARAEVALLPRHKPAPAAVPAGGYAVQLASVRSAADAEREWRRLKREFPGLLVGYGMTVDEATVDERGTFYRLRIGSFTDRSKAEEVCARLEAKKQDCLVLRR